jgi:thiol-disulfide isomerase/thioredoxin
MKRSTRSAPARRGWVALAILALLVFQLLTGRARAQGILDPGAIWERFGPPKEELVGRRAPELLGDTGWLNSKPLRIDDLKGHVVLLDFFDYTCVNCIRTFPHLRELERRYKKNGLVIVGVHTPEFAFGREEANVKRALERYGLGYPVALDANRMLWTQYRTRSWPQEFLIDRESVIRFERSGDGGYDLVEKEIRGLLAGAGGAGRLPPPIEPAGGVARGASCLPSTPEAYAGHLRGRLANPEGYQPNQVVDYADPGGHQEGAFYARGSWENRGQYLRHVRESSADYLRLPYRAIEVNAVLEAMDVDHVDVMVQRDGASLSRAEAGSDVRFDAQGRSFVRVAEPRMYQVLKNGAPGRHELVLSGGEPGLAVYVFSFGGCAVPNDGRPTTAEAAVRIDASPSRRALPPAAPEAPSRTAPAPAEARDG